MRTMRPRYLLTAAALATALATSLPGLTGARTRIEPEIRQLPEISGGWSPPRSLGGGNKPNRRKQRRRASGSKYQPHYGAKAALRNRMGGNAMRIRMERAGMVWDDGIGRYVPKVAA